MSRILALDTTGEFGSLALIEGDLVVDEENFFVLGVGRMIDPALETDELNYGDMVWTLEKRRNSDGASGVGFGRDGQVFLDHRYWLPGGTIDIAMDKGYLYVLCEDF